MISSLETNSEILESALNLPKNPNFDGYVNAVKIANLGSKYIASIIVTFSSAILIMLIYTMASFVLSRIKFKGREVIFLILVSAIFIPSNTILQPIFYLIRFLGLYDTKISLIIVYTGFSLPLALFIIRGYMLKLPVEIEESAIIEGASIPTVLSKIVAPLCQPAIVSVTILTFITNWNELLYALLLISSEKNRTLPLATRYFTQQFSFDYQALFSAVVLYILPSIVIYIFLQEKIAKGMIAGAVKG